MIYRKPHNIIPGVTSCCTAVHAAIRVADQLEIDADCVVDGDVLMCPIHHDCQIYVFGTNWWNHEGGSFEVNAKFDAWCCQGQHTIKVDAWSWRG